MPRLPENLLRCPLCSAPMGLMDGDRTLGCSAGHRFDAAKQGYFNLLTGRGTPFHPDTAEMVQARSDFLGAGHYDRLRATVTNLVLRHVTAPEVVLDAGAGTGFYLAELRRRNPDAAFVALDISKFALRRAASVLHSDGGDGVCLVWDVWRTLPVRESSADVLLNVFAPRNPEEFHRVLRRNGVLVVVTPLPGHLAEIADRAGLLEVPPDKANTVTAALTGLFQEIESVSVEYTLRLSPVDIFNAALMGPAGHHLAAAGLSARVAGLPERTEATARFTVQAFGRTSNIA